MCSNTYYYNCHIWDPELKCTWPKNSSLSWRSLECVLLAGTCFPLINHHIGIPPVLSLKMMIDVTENDNIIIIKRTSTLNTYCHRCMMSLVWLQTYTKADANGGHNMRRYIMPTTPISTAFLTFALTTFPFKTFWFLSCSFPHASLALLPLCGIFLLTGVAVKFEWFGSGFDAVTSH